MKNNKNILCLILVFVFASLTLVVAAESDEMKLLGITLEFGELVTIEEVYVSPIPGFPTEDKENPDYELRLLDSGGDILSTLKLTLPSIVFSADPSWFDEQTGEQIFIPESVGVDVKETYFLPFSKKIQYVSLIDLIDESEVFKEDIDHYVVLEPEISGSYLIFLVVILILVLVLIIFVLKKVKSFLKPKPIGKN
jgi:hypothetical protein